MLKKDKKMEDKRRDIRLPPSAIGFEKFRIARALVLMIY